MKHTKATLITLWLMLTASLLFTGCYTQFEVIERTVVVPDVQRQASDRYTERVVGKDDRHDDGEVVIQNEEDYTLGYEDGWEDAESYYFKDYETARWYKEHGVSLSDGVVVIHNYYELDPYYHGWVNPYFGFRSGYFGHPVYAGWGWNVGWHSGWSYWGWNVGYGYGYGFGYSPYYTVYPWGGWGSPWGGYAWWYDPYYRYGYGSSGYYGGVVEVERRTRTPRSTGMRSGATFSGRTRVSDTSGSLQSSVNRTRSSSRSTLRSVVRNSLRDHAVRSGARSSTRVGSDATTSRTARTNRSGTSVRTGTSSQSKPAVRTESRPTSRSGGSAVKRTENNRKSSNVRSQSSSSKRGGSATQRSQSRTTRTSDSSRKRDQEGGIRSSLSSRSDISRTQSRLYVDRENHLRSRLNGTQGNRASAKNRTSAFRQVTNVLGAIFDVTSVPSSSVRTGGKGSTVLRILDAVRTSTYSASDQPRRSTRSGTVNSSSRSGSAPQSVSRVPSSSGSSQRSAGRVQSSSRSSSSSSSPSRSRSSSRNN